MKIRGALRSRADAQMIWDYVSEPNNDPEWIAATAVLDVVGNAEEMEFSFQQRWGKKETWGTAKVTEWVEPHFLVWKVEDGFRRSKVTYVIEDGLFRQTNHTRFKKNRWLEPFMYPLIRRQMSKQLKALKLRLEERLHAVK